MPRGRGCSGEYDRDTFDDAARDEMTTWLAADPAHRRAYDKAARLWLLAGMVPPVNDIGGDDIPHDDAGHAPGKH
jgi:ferric-dicitrate binding protein FerR (iron transport regulator)